MIKRAPQMTEATRAEEEVVVKEIRADLDRLLEWQADDAPKAVIEESIRDGLYPRREGSMMDTLYTRLYFADDDEDDEVEMEDHDDEITEGVHETEKQVLSKSEESNELPLDQCSQTSRNSAALVHRTKKVQPGPTPSVSSDLATTQMLPAFQ